MCCVCVVCVVCALLPAGRAGPAWAQVSDARVSRTFARFLMPSEHWHPAGHYRTHPQAPREEEREYMKKDQKREREREGEINDIM